MTTTAPEERLVVGGGEGDFVLTAAAIATIVNGQLVGDPTVTIRGVAPLDRANRSDLSFLAASKYAEEFRESDAGAVLISPELADTEGRCAARIVVVRPHEALLLIVARLFPPPAPRAEIHSSATLGRSVKIGSQVSIGPNVVVGDGVTIGDGSVVAANVTLGAGVTIGTGTRIHPNTTLYPGTILGSNVIVHAGVRLGSDGYGYVFRDGIHEKIPHVGRCVVGDDVEIGANTTIDRGSVGDTEIGAGTKIDNLVQIGHNVRIGKHCLIMSQVGISGSARIEDRCIVAGQAGVGGHLTIGRGARVGGQAGVMGDVPAGETWSGYPARPHAESLRAYAALFRLAPHVRKIERFFKSRESDGTT